jgi:NAD(P)H-hydrate epimerase
MADKTEKRTERGGFGKRSANRSIMKLRLHPLRNLPVQAIPPAAWPARDARHLLVSGEQMAALEQQLFSSGLPVEALMEKAALALATRLLEQHGAELERHGAVVLVGPGHNGGDGLVVARELALRGLAVAIWSPFERHRPLTASHLEHAAWLGIPRLSQPPDPGGQALWIDALFGIGQTRPPSAQLQELLAAREQARPGGLVAIDVPTGLCADRGHCLGETAARARTTYCLGLLKSGLIQDPALVWVGRLERIDLGLPPALLATLPPCQPLALDADDLQQAPWPRPDPAAAKYGRGRLLVVAGSRRFPGAASLALAGADASGCGSLQAALPEPLAADLWSRAPQVVVRRALPCNAAGHLQLGALAGEDGSRLDALVLGPGLGHGPDGNPSGDSEAWEWLQQFPGLLLLDADGLNRLAGRGDGALPWLRQRQGPTWLTPHPGEFARLFPRWAALPPLQAAATAAEATGAAVLLKGARTVVSGPGNAPWQLSSAAAAAARAGQGDVLAGYAGGLASMAMAAGKQAPASVLALAALAHASSGEQLARLGPGCASPMAVATAMAAITSHP